MRHSCSDSGSSYQSDAFPSDISTFITEMKPRVQKIENPQNNVQVCSVQPTLPCLVDKGFDLIENNPEIVLYITIMVMTIMVVWSFKTVAQGSISFSCKPLGLHFEVKKGS